MHKVLLTGATGFLGSHIAEALCQSDIQVLALKRVTSDIWRCAAFAHKIIWIDLDDRCEWKSTIIDQMPTEIIHSAWIGVTAAERDNWSTQTENIQFFVDLLEIAQRVNVNKFIFLGSQAEYGNIESIVTEEQEVNPANAYAAVKLTCLRLLETYSKLNNLNWIWLRVFSVFGEKESEGWLIPSVIKKMQEESGMDFTLGEQRYAYVYVKDFAKILFLIVDNQVRSGIYNVSANSTLTLKDLLNLLKHSINPSFSLNFGALPYRKNQSMHIEGDISKLVREIGVIEFTDFNVALSNTINYYLSK